MLLKTLVKPPGKIVDLKAGGTASTPPTLNGRPPLRGCMSIHREGKPCSQLGRFLFSMTLLPDGHHGVDLEGSQANQDNIGGCPS